MFSVLLLSLAALAAALPTSEIDSRATKAYQIRGVTAPIFHLYLQGLPGSKSTPVLGPSTTAESFLISSTIQSTNTSLYLNILSSTNSYHPLSFNTTASTTAWGLEGDTIITTTGSVYGRQLNFLACASQAKTGAGYYDLFLQTGSDVPAGRTCSNYQTVHLPCLC